MKPLESFCQENDTMGPIYRGYCDSRGMQCGNRMTGEAGGGGGEGTAVVLVQTTVGAQPLAFAPVCYPLSLHLGEGWSV